MVPLEARPPGLAGPLAPSHLTGPLTSLALSPHWSPHLTGPLTSPPQATHANVRVYLLKKVESPVTTVRELKA